MLKDYKTKYIGHRKRLRKKFQNSNLQGWLDYEVLELFLTYCIPRKDTKPIAKRLIEKFNSISKVFDAKTSDLLKIDGVSEKTTIFIKFVRELIFKYLEDRIYKKDLLRSPEDVFKYLVALLRNSPDEQFLALFLDKQNHLISIEVLQRGTVDSSVVYPRKVVEYSLIYHASKVIIAHNHPGGSLKPSENDLQVTRSIRDALKTIEVLLLDHLIIAGNNYYSFKEHNFNE